MAAAERIAEYLKQCGVFYLATLDGIWPRLRPMSNVCVCGGVIHFLFNIYRKFSAIDSFSRG